MKHSLDFDDRQSLDKMLHAYSVKQVVPDGDMEVYLVILATVKAPAEIWQVVPENLKSGLRNLVETSIELGPNKRAFVGGAFESYWTHAAAERWHQFFQQNAD